MAVDKLQGYTHSDSDLFSVNNTVWAEHLQHLPDCIKAIYSNVKLLRKCAGDARKDAQLWANRSEGDQGKEFDEPEERLAVGSTWRPGEVEMRCTLYDLLANKKDGDSIIHGSQSLSNLVDKLHKAGFCEPTPEPSQDQGHQIWSQNELDLPKSTLNVVKAAQLRLHKQKILAIERDDEDARIQAAGQCQEENGFGRVRRIRNSSDLGGHRTRPEFHSDWTGGSRKDDTESPTVDWIRAGVRSYGPAG
jgi:hypothetical protein